jgi:hypothetical protein
MDREVWTLVLKVAGRPSAGTYAGTIATFHDGKLLKTKRIVFTAAQGALAVEPLLPLS